MKLAKLCLLLILLLQAASSSAGPLITERINVNPTTGAQANGISYSPVLSADGCIVAFVSKSTTLAPASYGLTTNSPAQVYAVNRCVIPHTIELISVTNDGTAAADAASFVPNISADGRYVAFVSLAGNLPQNTAAPNQNYLVFVRDRLTHTTLSPFEAWRPTPQNNGGIGVDVSSALRYMSADASEFLFKFSSAPTIQQNIYVVKFSGGMSTLQGICPTTDNSCLAGTSSDMTLSADSSKVLLQSTYAFVAGGAAGLYSVYSYDVATAASTLVSVNGSGVAANASVEPLSDMGQSADGHLVAFSSDTATNFPGNTSNTLILKNTTSGAATLISAKSDGTPVKLGYGYALPQLSADGNRVAFTAENQLVPHSYQVGPDAVVADLTLGRLGSACISASGSFGNNGCDGVTISADGKWVAFRSVSTNLVPNDTNGYPDIYVVALDPAVDVVFSNGFEP